MSTSARVAAIGACLLALAAPAPADAGPVDDLLSALSWRAPAGCPDGAEVAIRVATHLGDSDAIATDDLTISAVVSGSGRRWHLAMQFHLGDAEGERALDAPSCAELAESAALIIALALDPTLDAPTPDAAALDAAPDAGTPAGDLAPAAGVPAVVVAAGSADGPPVEVATADGPLDDETPPDARLGRPAAPTVETRAAATRSGLPFSVLVSAFAAADVGTLPAIGTGVGAAIDLARGRWTVGVTGGYWFEQSATPQGNVYVIAAGGRVCRRLIAGFWACAGAEIERLHGKALGVTDPVDPPADNLENWSTAILGVVDGVYRVPVAPRVTLRLDVQFGIAPQRAGFYEELPGGEQGPRIHQTGLVIGRSFASLELSIP